MASYFYKIYDHFRRDNYEQAINAVKKYQVRQSISGFRRIYNTISKTLENIEYREKLDSDTKARLLRELTRIQINVQYQANRRVINQDLANGIETAINEIIRDISSENLKDAIKRATALKDALDAVLAYRITARSKEEEEEELL